jgi:hypothetical protein
MRVAGSPSRMWFLASIIAAHRCLLVLSASALSTSLDVQGCQLAVLGTEVAKCARDRLSLKDDAICAIMSWCIDRSSRRLNWISMRPDGGSCSRRGCANPPAQTSSVKMAPVSRYGTSEKPEGENWPQNGASAQTRTGDPRLGNREDGTISLRIQRKPPVLYENFMNLRLASQEPVLSHQ